MHTLNAKYTSIKIGYTLVLHLDMKQHLINVLIPGNGKRLPIASCLLRPVADSQLSYQQFTLMSRDLLLHLDRNHYM